MRIFVLLLLLAGLSVSAGEFVDKAVGLKMNVPDGWERDEAREKGSVKFAASLSVAPDKYVTLTVEAVPADGFSAVDWLSNEKKFKASRYIAEVATRFTSDQDTRVGGLDAIGYVFGGKSKDLDGTIHFKVYGVVHGEIFFKITESSFNGAHNKVSDQLKEIWDGIMFQEGEGDEDDAGGDSTPGIRPATGTETPVEDQLGNYKATLPPGWEIRREAPIDKDVQRRMEFVRKFGDYDIVVFEIWRIPLRDASVFNTGTPDEVLQRFNKNSKFFETFYGQSSSDRVHPQMDEGVGFGGARKAGAYELSSITTDEMAQIAAAEKKIKKGIKDVTVPEFKPLIVRGRLAMVSPNVYLTRAYMQDRRYNEDPQLVAEIKKIHDSFQLLTTKAAPPPLEVQGKKIGDTTTDPEFAKARKRGAARQVQGRKTYRVEYTFTVPVGWALKNQGLGGDAAFMVWAQDGTNNWITVSIFAVSHRKASEERKKYPKETQFATWRSNWSAKARGAKIPDKRQKFALGKMRGEGYRDLKGNVSGFHGTFTGLLSDKFPGKGWRTYTEVETRGDGDKVFGDALKKFLKSIKAKNVKVK